MGELELNVYGGTEEEKIEGSDEGDGELGAYVSKTHILDKLRVDVRLCDEGFESLVDNEIEGRIL